MLQKITGSQIALVLIILMSCGLITATVEGETGSALTNVFTLDTRLTPTIQTVTPGSGSVSGGTSVTIRGTNFVVGMTTVKFGDKSATNVVVQSSTQLTTTTPANSAGQVDVQSINPGGTIATLANGFTYEAPTAAKVTVNASPASIVANGQMIAQITATVEATDGTRITDETVNLAAERGQIDSTAKHQGNGVYTATYTAATIAGDVKITAVTGNGKLGTTTVRLTEREIDVAKSTVAVDLSTVTADGKTQATVTITVVDKQGLPMSGKDVVVEATPQDGVDVVQPSSTNVAGVATAKVSATKAGVATITATVDDVSLSQKPTIEFFSGEVTHGAIEAGGLHTAGEIVQVTVTLKNAQDRPVAGKTVELHVTPEDGVAITQPGAKTDAFGRTTATFTSTKAELKTISAEAVEDNLVLTETAAVIFNAAVPEKVSVSVVDNLTVSSSTVVTASVTDQYNNPVKNTDVEFTATLGELTASTNNGDGTYTTAYTAGQVAGEVRIQAKTPNGKVGTATATLKEKEQPTFGTLIGISFAADASPQMIAGGLFQFSLIGSDAAGQTQEIAGSDAVWGVSGGVGTISDTGELTVTTIGKGTVKATLKSNATINVESNEITVLAASAVDVQVSSSTLSLAGGSGDKAELTIIVADEFENPVTNETITLTISPQNGSITKTATHQGNGVYKATYTAGEAGEVFIEAQTSNTVTGNITLTVTEAPPLSITLDRSSLNFGTVGIGQSKSETLIITNPNDSDLVVSSITSSQTDFTANPTSFTLQPGGNQPVTVTFTPSTEGVISGTLAVIFNDGAKTIPMSGIGEKAEQIFGRVTEISFEVVPSTLIAGATVPFNLIGKDANGLTQPIDSSDVAWETIGGIGTVDKTGELNVTTVGKGTVKVTLKANPTIIAETAEITVISAPAENVQVSVNPDTLTAGSGETALVTIIVTDEFGNAVTGQTITLTVADEVLLATTTEVKDGVYNAAYMAVSALDVGVVEIRATTPNGVVGTATLTLTEKETVKTATFEISARDEVMIADAGEGTVSYRLRLDGKNGFSDTIELLVNESPPNITIEINPKEITLTEADPIDIANLTLTFASDIAAGDYSFTVLAISIGGIAQRLTLTLKVEALERVETRLILALQATTVALMETLNLSGDLVPLTNMPVELANATVTITFTSPSGEKGTFEATTDDNGHYKLATPFFPDEVGEWNVTSGFAGNDELKATERESPFTVTKGVAKISFSSGETGVLGTAIEIVGRLEPGLEGKQISLKILRPDGAASTLTDITTETLGVFRHSLKLEIAGEWTITATWSGNDQYKSATQTLVISVSEEVGKAILVLGGGNRSDNKDWDRFNGLAEYVHKIFLKRQFDDDKDIQFLSPDPTQTAGADTQTTLSTLELAITNWAKPQVNSQVPLYLYLLSHNLDDQFLLEKRSNSETFLSPSLLAEWLSQLPLGTPITIIIEACHSGNFITQSNGSPTQLVSQNRTIIVSARGDKQAKILRNRSSFSKTFFDQIDANKTVAEAFQATEAKMKRSPLHRDQFPQIDADGNGMVNEPQDFATVEKRYLPADIVSLGDPPEFIKLTEPRTLAEGISSMRIETELLGVGITHVSATVIPPGFDPNKRIDDWGILAFDEFDLAKVSEGKYAAAYANFTQPGEYTVIVNASNTDGSAEAVQTTITVPGGTTPATPWDVDGSGVVDIFDLVIVGSNFGKAGVDVKGDANGDGMVNIFDLVLVGQHFGERP